MKIVMTAEETAKLEWRKRHPWDEWPFDGRATPGASERKKSEARELIEAAQQGRPFSSVPHFNYVPAATISYSSSNDANAQLHMQIQEWIQTYNQSRPPLGKTWPTYEEEQRWRDLQDKIWAGLSQIERNNSRIPK